MNGITRFVSGAALALALVSAGASAQQQGPAAPAATITQPPPRDPADLAVLEPVRDYKARHGSTMLAFDAVVEALDKAEQGAA